MNDIDEFLEVTAAIFVIVVALMVWLTYLEQSLSADRKPRPPRTGPSGVAAELFARVKARRGG